MSKFTVLPPHSCGGIHIPRSVKGLYLVMKDGKRFDSFLHLVNAKNAIKHYREQELDRCLITQQTTQPLSRVG